MLVWHEEGYQVRRNWGLHCGYVLEWSANDLHISSWCHSHHIISCIFKIQNDLPFWWQVVVEVFFNITNYIVLRQCTSCST